MHYISPPPAALDVRNSTSKIAHILANDSFSSPIGKQKLKGRNPPYLSTIRAKTPVETNLLASLVVQPCGRSISTVLDGKHDVGNLLRVICFNQRNPNVQLYINFLLLLLLCCQHIFVQGLRLVCPGCSASALRPNYVEIERENAKPALSKHQIHVKDTSFLH